MDNAFNKTKSKISVKYGIVWLYKYHFQVLPKIMWSDVRWGLLQVYLSVALFLVVLYFPFQPKAGEPMAIGNYFAYVFLGFGGLLILYTAFLSYRFMRSGSLKGTLQDNASKKDIVDLKDDLNSKLGILITEIKGLRQDIKDGACKYDKPKQ